MLLTITHTAAADERHVAADLGYLLYKHPAKLQSFPLSVGTAHVFYPEATDERCTAALLLEVDPIELVRSKRFGGNDAHSLGHYVNDRPYASSSMLAVALGQVFSTAMTGRCDSRPELAATSIALDITLTAVPSRGADGLPERMFAPLGWHVDSTPIALDPAFPEWGDSPYVNLRLRGTLRLADALHQLYVLLPVLDDSKHYWVSDDEVAKLLRAGEGWLPQHPDRDLITRRYLAHQRSMVTDATARLTELDDTVPMDAAPIEAARVDAVAVDAAPAGDRARPLAALRADAVVAALHEVHAHRVADLGCGEGALLQRLLADAMFTDIVGTDVSSRSLGAAADRLHLRDLSDRQRDRIQLLQSSVTYLDGRIRDLDALVLMEVIEHVDLDRHAALETSVFDHARPGAVIVTTPNAEYNANYPSLAAGAFRHPDHRFEWTRSQFQRWADGVAARHGYTVDVRAVGESDAVAGAPTQLALFTKSAE